MEPTKLKKQQQSFKDTTVLRIQQSFQGTTVLRTQQSFQDTESFKKNTFSCFEDIMYHFKEDTSQI